MAVCNMAHTWRWINVQNQDSHETHPQDEDRHGPQESSEWPCWNYLCYEEQLQAKKGKITQTLSKKEETKE